MQDWLPALRWSHQCLDELLGRFVRSLPDVVASGCVKYIEACGDVAWASGCTGAETPMYCFDALGRALANHWGAQPQFVHRCGAEIVPEKQNYLMRASKHGKLVGDIFHLVGDEATNLRTGVSEPVPMNGLFPLITGFSCRTASGLAIDKLKAETCVQDFSGTTGETLYHLSGSFGMRSGKNP